MLCLLATPMVVCGQPDDAQPARHYTLAQAIAQALVANRGLKGSALDLEGRRESLTAAAAEFDTTFSPETRGGVVHSGSGLDRDWRIGAGLAVERRFETGLTARATPRVDRVGEDTISGVSLALDVPLLRGLGREVNLDTVRSAEFGIRSADRSFQASRSGLVVETVAAVYDIVRQRAMLDLLQSQVERLQGYAINSRLKEKAGMGSPIDVYRTEIRIKTSQSALTLAREGLKAAEDRLKLLLALPLQDAITVEAPLQVAPVKLTTEAAVEIARQHRVEVAQAHDELAEAQRRVEIARNTTLPELDLVAAYAHDAYRGELAEAFGDSEQTYSVNLVSRTDFARSAEKAALRRSLLDADRTRLGLEQREAEIARQVRLQLDLLQKLAERQALSEEQIRQAQGKVALSEIKYRHGLGDNFDLIESESELQEARVGSLAARTDTIVGTFRLRSVLGTLISLEEGAPVVP